MRRSVIAGVLLLLGGSICARSKPEPLVFVFLRVDAAQGVAILRPMIAPDIGVQLDSGSRELKQGAILRCDLSAREHAAIVEGEVAKVSEMVLDCDERRFIVKTIDFRPRRQ
jgi:hypothetical protein